MPRTRIKVLLILLPAIMACVIAIATYLLWARLTRAGAELRPTALHALPALPESAAASTLAAVEVQPRKLPRVGSGTEIGTTTPAGWSHLVLHGKPSIAAGDVDKVSPAVSRLVSLFQLVILADVAKEAKSRPPVYRLRTVAIGLATEIGGRPVIVSSKSQKSLGANLRLREISALTGNEANLDQTIQVARTPTMTVFDAAAIMRRENENRQVVHRHALLVRPEDGRLSTFVWTLEPAADGRYQLADGKVRLLPRNLHQDRKLFVDARRFVLGLPAQEAFALIDLPPGVDVPADPQLQVAAESPFESTEDVLRLQSLLCEAAEIHGPHD